MSCMQWRWVNLAAAGLLVSGASVAQTWPSKPVRVVTPWPAGGLTDVVGRIVFQKMGENLGRSFVMENRGGASGTIGAEVVARTAPDGYTLMVHSMSHLTNPFTFKKLGYDTLNDFVPIGMMARQTGLLVVHPSLPARSVKELIALAKARPNQITYSETGSGGFAHLSMVLLGSMTGTQMMPVPYKGGGPAMTGLVSGETQVLVASPAPVAPQLAAKRVRLLAVTSERRLAAFPDTPTLDEAGIKGYEFTGWVGVFGPAGLPPAIVDRVNAEIRKSIESPETRKRMEEFEPWTMTPKEMAARIESDYQKIGRLMKLVGIRPD